VLISRAGSWKTGSLLRIIDSFSKSLVLYKTKGPFAKRLTFYVVARGVDVESVAAKKAVEILKRDWQVCTLGDEPTGQ